MISHRWPAYSAIAGFTAVALGCLFSLGVQKPLTLPQHGGTVTVLAEPSPAPALGAGPAAQEAAPDAGYYNQLRARLRWVQTRMGGDMLLTPDLNSRMLLAKSAARHARLSEVGLNFQDVYGIINAETSWVPRTGASKDGTPNLGIAQFEPATARALGVRDPQDPVEAVHAAALHMKDAARWSAERLEGITLHADERAEKLREGVSIYYNLSTRGRNAWNGRNTARLPRETQRHIENARLGAQEAAVLEAQLQAVRAARSLGPAVMTANTDAIGG
ncbi:MAG TPA: hypothetical protein VLI46_13565 [Ramlibacter sp.]|nr:hypothetical protein [Ramlibacter sp.]